MEINFSDEGEVSTLATSFDTRKLLGDAKSNRSPVTVNSTYYIPVYAFEVNLYPTQCCYTLVQGHTSYVMSLVS